MSGLAPEGLVLCDSVALSKNDPVVGATNGDATVLGVLSDGLVHSEGLVFSEGLVLSETDLQAYGATGDGIVFGE